MQCDGLWHLSARSSTYSESLADHMNQGRDMVWTKMLGWQDNKILYNAQAYVESMLLLFSSLCHLEMRVCVCEISIKQLLSLCVCVSWAELVVCKRGIF